MAAIFEVLTHPVAMFLAAMLIVTTIHVGFMGLAGRACGAAVEEVGIGYGPTLLTVRLGATELALRPVPLGGYARFAEYGGEAPSIDELPLIARCAVAVSGCVALLAVAWLLGGSDALYAGWRALVAIGNIPFAPGEALSEPTLRAAQFVALAPFPAIIARAAAVVATINLLPVPPLNGGQILVWLFEAAGMPRETSDTLVRVGFSLILVALVLWLSSSCLAWLNLR
jgi:membrane-associated protease RseP (regulator of RpoE activity)